MDEAELRLYLGKQVKYLRHLANLTQAQLAEKTNLSVNYISEIETGIASPTLKTLLKLAQELDVDIKELFNFGQRVPSKDINSSKKKRETE
jgi:transcriptional regulator with XRE-family HTH domain